MKKLSLTIAALLSMAGFSTASSALGGVNAIGTEGGHYTTQPATKVKSAAKDTSSNRLDFSEAWTLGTKRGKAYRATVAQHRRNASKARNTQRNRQANKG